MNKKIENFIQWLVGNLPTVLAVVGVGVILFSATRCGTQKIKGWSSPSPSDYPAPAQTVPEPAPVPEKWVLHVTEVLDPDKNWPFSEPVEVILWDQSEIKFSHTCDVQGSRKGIFDSSPRRMKIVYHLNLLTGLGEWNQVDPKGHGGLRLITKTKEQLVLEHSYQGKPHLRSKLVRQ